MSAPLPFSGFCAINSTNFEHIGRNSRDAGLSFLFPAVLFYSLDDRIQKLLLLACRAIQRFQPLVHSCGMDIGHPSCQFFFALFGLGIIHDHIDRSHFSDNGHLLLRCA